MPVPMHSHSCTTFQSRVLLCGSPTNETACIRLISRYFSVLRHLYFSYSGAKFSFEGQTQVGHALGAMLAYPDPYLNMTFPTIIGGKTGNIATAIVEQYGPPYWRQFDNFPTKIYG